LASAYVAPVTAVEKVLVEIFRDFLKIEKLGIHDNFFELGGDSLKAIAIIGRVNKAFNVRITIDKIFESPTIALLAPGIAGAKKNTFIDIEKAEKKEFYPLSYNQNRMWILHQLEPGTSAFNMPNAIAFRHEVEEELIKKTVSSLLQRHESLRTGFKVVNGEPVQFISEKIEIPLEKIDISSLENKEKQVKKDQIYAELVLKSFDLSRPPLFRMLLLKQGTQLYELMFNIHHIVTDGWSNQVLKRDFFLVYEAYRQGTEPCLESLTLQYCDFTQWHHSQLDDPNIKEKSHRFWKTKLESGIPCLRLPEDFKGHEHNRQGAGYEIRFDGELKEKLKSLATDVNTTLFTVMFASFILFLYRFSQQEEITLSIINAGRGHISLQKIMGFFVNSVIFKTCIHTGESFRIFIKRINRDILETFLHQAYPLELVCKDLGIRYPDIPVTFNMLNLQEETENLTLDSFKPRHNVIVNDVRFDLEPYITVYKNGIKIHLVYKKQRFAPETIEYMMGVYYCLLSYFVQNSHKTYNAYMDREKGHIFKKRKKRN
jgi:acyl carrier protein